MHCTSIATCAAMMCFCCHALLQESGHKFTVRGSPRNYRGTLALVLADNPASCALGGCISTLSPVYGNKRGNEDRGICILLFYNKHAITIFSHSLVLLHLTHFGNPFATLLSDTR